jgi:hypothetical protein
VPAPDIACPPWQLTPLLDVYSPCLLEAAPSTKILSTGVATPPLNLAGDRRDLAANTTWFRARIRFLIWQRCVELEETGARGLGNTNWALPEVHIRN